MRRLEKVDNEKSRKKCPSISLLWSQRKGEEEKAGAVHKQKNLKKVSV